MDASSVRMLARSAVRVASRSLKASSPAVAVAAREFQSSVKNGALGAAEISSILEGRISSFYEDVNIDEIGRVLTVVDGIGQPIDGKGALDTTVDSVSLSLVIVRLARPPSPLT